MTPPLSMGAAALALALLATAPVLVVAAVDDQASDSGLIRVPVLQHLQYRPDDEDVIISSHHLSQRQDVPVAEVATSPLIYSASVSVGSPPQQLRLRLDTGSPRTWIKDANSFPSSSNANDPRGFSSTASSSFKDLGATDPITYADQTTITGNLASDAFTLGSATLTDFQFMLAKAFTAQQESRVQGSEGLLGLSFPLQNSKYPTFFDTLQQQGAISVFTASLYIDSSKGAGELTLGGYDPAFFAAGPSTTPTWVNLVDSSYVINGITLTNLGTWAVPITAIAVGSNTFAMPSKTASVIDSGTNIGTLNADVLASIAAAIPGSSNISPPSKPAYYSVPCDGTNGGPTVSFTLGSGAQIFATPADYIVPGLTAGTCAIAFLGVPGAGAPLIGMTVLQRYVTIFDYKDRVIGFALAKGRTPATGAADPVAGSATGPPTPSSPGKKTGGQSKSSSPRLCTSGRAVVIAAALVVMFNVF